jgi:hypothetical protein
VFMPHHQSKGGNLRQIRDRHMNSTWIGVDLIMGRPTDKPDPTHLKKPNPTLRRVEHEPKVSPELRKKSTQPDLTRKL